jgi:hypothetical protein
MNGRVVTESATNESFTLSVCEFVPRIDRNGSNKPVCSTNLYVKNFPQPNLTEQQLAALF